jgi:hypothetical protein
MWGTGGTDQRLTSALYSYQWSWYAAARAPDVSLLGRWGDHSRPRRRSEDRGRVSLLRLRGAELRHKTERRNLPRLWPRFNFPDY